MARSKSSQRWLKEHFSDPYVKSAQQKGYRSRAVFKLIEIQNKDKIIQSGMTVIDLGAAPGGWSQIVSEWIGKKGKIIALDILPMDDLPDVHFVLGDFRESEIFEKVVSLMGENKADVVLSDMAPNTSGQASVDQPRAMFLAELSFELAKKTLKKQGTLVVKVFQGEGIDAFIKALKGAFKQVLIRKPDASRSRSRESYLVAKGFML
ncbi:MAG TPA: 23S rRNA (uridine(2552)-2'-O)-methyltransferase RlmE [Gammaproteobacteria bacterium]|nr:23S rRNA (uridine(2552)-2'-O)-methyltransferase RlmE [Gammaproteobacteria bacterium]